MRRNLRKEFAVAVGAGEAAIRIDTDEVQDCVGTLVSVCQKHGWELRIFDPLVGVQSLAVANGSMLLEKKTEAKAPGPIKGPADLIAAVGNNSQGPANTLQCIMDFWNEAAKIDPAVPGEVLSVVLVIKNFQYLFERNREMAVAVLQHITTDKVSDHKLYDGPGGLKQTLYKPNNIDEDSDTGKFIVGLCTAETKLPPEVSPLFKHLVHELPDEEELDEILSGICAANQSEEDEDNATDLLSPEMRKKICGFARGLTRLQAEGVFASSMVQHKTVDPAYVWNEKSKILNKEGLVTLYQGKESFKDVAGLDGMKEYILKLLTPSEYDASDPDVRAKGLLACGPPGTGKSLIAKAAGNELGLPILLVNPGNWMGQYVGESEARTRRGFDLLRAHSPCVAVVDEVEKVMPQSRNSGGDSGVGARMEGSFLTAMNDIQELIFWMFTANDVRRMHEAFFRAERVDGVFYVKLPGPVQRAALWRLYGKKFFPEEVKLNGSMERFPGHISTDVETVLHALRKAKKVNVEDWANKFTLSLMCIADVDERQQWMTQIQEVSSAVADMISLVADDGWSPAEIRACCRLSRILGEPLTKTQMRIRPVSVSAANVILHLEDWAEEAALDAETGELYRRDAVNTEDTQTGNTVRVFKKPRRKVRKAD